MKSPLNALATWIGIALSAALLSACTIPQPTTNRHAVYKRQQAYLDKLKEGKEEVREIVKEVPFEQLEEERLNLISLLTEEERNMTPRDLDYLIHEKIDKTARDFEVINLHTIIQITEEEMKRRELIIKRARLEYLRENAKRQEVERQENNE